MEKLLTIQEVLLEKERERETPRTFTHFEENPQACAREKKNRNSSQQQETHTVCPKCAHKRARGSVEKRERKAKGRLLSNWMREELAISRATSKNATERDWRHAWKYMFKVMKVWKLWRLLKISVVYIVVGTTLRTSKRKKERRTYLSKECKGKWRRKPDGNKETRWRLSYI